MRPLIALFVLFILASPILPLLDHSMSDARADSFSKWGRVFHLHDGAYLSAGKYDWMNSSGPYNFPYIDYDSDGLPGITIKKNVPPQRYHAWYLYPPVSTQMNLSGSLAAYVWAKSQGNDSGTVVQATFYDITTSQFPDPTLGTLIGSATSSLVGPFYSEFQLVSLVIPSVTYTLPAGHVIALVIERGDSINDWLIVHFDRSDYDSFVALTTDKFISMDYAWIEDSTGYLRSTYSDLEDIVACANVSDPFGAVDIQGAYASVRYAVNGTVVVSMQSLALVSSDQSATPYWMLFKGTLPQLLAGDYIANVTARDSQGYPSWRNVTFKVISVDHFDVIIPSIIVAGNPFPVNLTARDSSNQVVTEWIGTVQLAAYRTDKLFLANGTLSNTSVQFNVSDLGRVNISDETYGYAEEQIFVKASAGPRFGWSNLVTVRSGPIVAIDLSPSTPQVVVAGQNRSFSAVGYDSLGNVNTTWTPYWSITSSIGAVVVNGLAATFYAAGAGVGNITCRNNMTDANDTVWIVVTSAALYRINISSPSYPLVIHEGENIALTATGYDEFNNTVTIAGAMWDTTTSGSVIGSGTTATYYARYVPGSGIVECRLGDIVGSLGVTVLTSEYGPSITDIDPQVASEDSEGWELSLFSRIHRTNGTDKCFWWVEGVNYSLYFVLHDPESNYIMRFFPQPDQSGDDQFTLWVIDEEGYTAYRNVLVSITPVNDPPRFVNHPPTELYVTFDTEYTFDYTYYIDDVDNTLDELSLFSDGGSNVWFESHEAHFNYSGKSSYFKIVEIRVQDTGGASSGLSIVVKVTRDIPPSLNASLPDLVITEGIMNYFAFDLDDYFYDLDGQVLIYTTGFENIPAPFINTTTHRVYFSAPGEWSGVTEGTFTATDPEGALKSDTITVTVIAVNDAPAISNIETIYVHFEQTYYLYLSSYVNDPDNPLETLMFQLNDTHVVLGISATGAERLELRFPANLSGPDFNVYSNPYRVYVMMNVTDPIGERASATFEVFVTDDEPPQVVAENPEQLFVSFPEDTYLNNTLLLYDLIRDPDDDVLNFAITSSGNKVRWSIDETTGFVSLSASVNWSGTETLSITGKDPSGAWAFVQIFVIVTPVNDPPIIVNPLHDMIVTGGPRNTQYDISGVFYDNESESLTIMATPEGNAQVVGTTLFVSLPAGEDVITVTLQATDGEFVTSLVIFKVGVRKTIAERIGYPYTLPLVLLAAGVAGYFIGSRLPRPFNLENLFLIHNDGRLVAHVTKEENTTLDKDVVSAMFTAVQEFVRDSFQKGEVGLKRLEIGDKNVMIEKGKSAYLALIYSGYPQKEVFDNLPVLLRDIEERYKEKLEKWNGTMKAVPGVDKMLQEYMASAFKPGSWHEEEEIAEEEWVDILNKEA